ncbi:hypothetical protein JRO89_XS05G0016800 [Xanthoceras sorbifolium]|uniref:HD domain-containing protein n=1 Tax=Xanthoceras sorbifolium TaxID=99658 RepID=A0ABQ8I0B5_9ROSI|nr:hypothetical protein JRO89_XS05G0016800 [Xanthoceras sorbifolium]
MAVNSSTHCTPPLNRPLPPRLPLLFFNRSSYRPVSSNEASNPRVLSVRAHIPGSDAFGSNKSVSLTDAEAPIESSSSSTSSAIDFLTLCHSLKKTKRKGWINHGIKGPESIADHMYRMALMSLIVGDLPGVNRERCIKIAIVHDIAEAIVGDITPSDGVPKVEKSRMEQAALNEMCKVLGGGMRAEEIKELWAEYENNASIEANLVKDFDKGADSEATAIGGFAGTEAGSRLMGWMEVEMILQALEYEMEHGKVLDEFFLSTSGKFQTEIGKSWAAEINSRRNSRLGIQA